MMAYVELGILPIMACLVVALLHTWFGIHVVKREIIFIDLALAQVAALGAAVGLLWDWEIGTIPSFSLGVLFTIICSIIFAQIKSGSNLPSKEAYIGITYAVASALVILVLDKTPEGAEHLKIFLLGTILTVELKEILWTGLVYVLIAGVLFIIKDKLYLTKMMGGKMSRKFDFLFYLLFGLTVTLSVKMMGVLLVFSFLIIPAVSGMLYFQKIRFIVYYGWSFSIVSSIIGICISFVGDFPMGASIVVAFALLMLLMILIRKILNRA